MSVLNVIDVFLRISAQKSFDDLLSLAVYCRDRINPYMFMYSLSVTLLHRTDTRHLELPSHAEMFPSLYMDASVFGRAREESAVINKPGSRVSVLSTLIIRIIIFNFNTISVKIPIEIPHDYTASNLDAEHRISYFREDIGVNLHHWHWHLVYPYEGPISIVNKDRRGELFYYMHQQIVAR